MCMFRSHAWLRRYLLRLLPEFVVGTKVSRIDDGGSSGAAGLGRKCYLLAAKCSSNTNAFIDTASSDPRCIFECDCVKQNHFIRIESVQRNQLEVVSIWCRVKELLVNQHARRSGWTRFHSSINPLPLLHVSSLQFDTLYPGLIKS